MTEASAMVRLGDTLSKSQADLLCLLCVIANPNYGIVDHQSLSTTDLAALMRLNLIRRNGDRYKTTVLGDDLVVMWMNDDI
jgi:hypothetical protein